MVYKMILGIFFGSWIITGISPLGPRYNCSSNTKIKSAFGSTGIPCGTWSGNGKGTWLISNPETDSSRGIWEIEENSTFHHSSETQYFSFIYLLPSKKPICVKLEDDQGGGII